MRQTCILIGHPVGHSVSPVIHQTAYRLLGLDAVYELRDAPTEAEVRALVEQVRCGAILGANVTVPHKLLALEAADVLDPSAELVGAANVLLRDEQGRVVAKNTDTAGLADELSEARSAFALELGSRNSALIVGGGGAALASVLAARRAGFQQIWVTARRYDPACPQAEWPLASRLGAMGASLLPWPGHAPGALDRLRPELGAVIQATSAGMMGKDGGEALSQLLRLSEFQPLIAYDLVYNPAITPFVREAARHGHRASSGLGMLVGQAAHAIEAWFGRLPPKAPLLDAARKALGL